MSMFRSLMNDWIFCQNNTGLIITMNRCWILKRLKFHHSVLRYKASWLANDIAINSILHFNKGTEFCFLDFHEIIGLFSANQKQNPLTLFL